MWIPISDNMQHFKAGLLHAPATSVPNRSPLMSKVCEDDSRYKRLIAELNISAD